MSVALPGVTVPTITVLVAVAVFPLLSVALYVNVYVPAVFVFTVPVVVTVSVPSTLSWAVAPGSVNASPCESVIVAAPFNVMTGGVVSPVGFASTTVTVTPISVIE